MDTTYFYINAHPMLKLLQFRYYKILTMSMCGATFWELPAQLFQQQKLAKQCQVNHGSQRKLQDLLITFSQVNLKTLAVSPSWIMD